MDDLLAEGLEILDSDSIRTTKDTFAKSKKAAQQATKASKTHKNFKKIAKKNLADQKAKYGLNQKYKGNAKVAGVVKRGKVEEREKRRQKVLQSIKVKNNGSISQILNQINESSDFQMFASEN